MPDPAATRLHPGFGRRFLPMAALALLGVGGLALKLWPQLPAMVLPPPLVSWPQPAVLLMLMVQPLLLTLAGAAVGAALAHRVGLRSVLAATAPAPTAAPVWWMAAGIGFALALGITLVDAVWAGHLGASWQALRQREAAAATAGQLLAHLLYGGLAEELMLRWGLMSLLAWAVWRLGGGAAAPGWRTMALAIGLSALLFAWGHLPALAASVTLTPGLMARTLLLNLVAGAVFGWLYWRHHLEAAMLAHACSHVGLFAAARLIA